MKDKTSLISDLIKARKEISSIKKNTKAFNYKYAPLDEVINTILHPLLDNGLIITQEIFTNKEDKKPYMLTALRHVSGETLESVLEIPIMGGDGQKRSNELQAFGSSITYLRRYALLALLCLATEDDDGSVHEQKQSYSKKSTITDAQFRMLSAKIGNNSELKVKICSHYKIDTLADLPFEAMQTVLKRVSD